MSVNTGQLASSFNQALSQRPAQQSRVKTNKEEIDDLVSTAPRTDRMYYGMKLIIEEKCLWGRCNTLCSLCLRSCVSRASESWRQNGKGTKTSNCKWEKIQRREKSKEPTGLKTIMTKACRLSSLMLCFHTVACQDKHRVHDRANTWDCMLILKTTLHHVTSHGENNPVSLHRTEPVSGPGMISLAPAFTFLSSFRGQYLETSTWLISL